MPTPIKIVFVDDSADLCKLVKSNLERDGQFAVAISSDPHTVEELVARENPDIILLDIVMPDRNGQEIIVSLKKNPDTKKIPIIVVSGKGEMIFNPKKQDFKWEPNNPLAKSRGDLPDFKSAEAMAEAYGVADYLAKPFSTDILIQVIQDVYKKTRRPASEEGDQSGESMI